MAHCELCGAQNVPTERHHIFGGARRPLSEKYGLVAELCHWCHNEPPSGVHHNAETRAALQAKGQRKAMREQGWDADAFRAVFGKTYLDEDDLAELALPGAADDFMVVAMVPLPVWF